jgi:hypothetical protein
MSLIVGTIVAVALMYSGMLGDARRGGRVSTYGRAASMGDDAGPGALRRASRKRSRERKARHRSAALVRADDGADGVDDATLTKGKTAKGAKTATTTKSAFADVIASEDRKAAPSPVVDVDPVDLSLCATAAPGDHNDMSSAQHLSWHTKCAQQLSKSIPISIDVVDVLDDRQLFVMVDAAKQVPPDVAGTRHGSDGGLAALATSAGGTPSEEALLALQTLSDTAYTEAIESNAGAADVRNTLIFELLRRTAIPESVFQACSDLRLAELASRLPTVPPSQRLLASAGDGGVAHAGVDVSAAATMRATVSDEPTERMREYMYALVGRDDVNAMLPDELRNTFIETIREVVVRCYHRTRVSLRRAATALNNARRR